MKQEQELPVLVVDMCGHCVLTLHEDGTGEWSCDDYHPEVLAQMEERDRREDEEA